MRSKTLVDELPPLPDVLAESTPQQSSRDIARTASTRDLLAAELIAQPIRDPIFRLRSLRCGCYLANYTPNGVALSSFDGTIRVECHDAGRTASGDLYQRPIIFVPIGSYSPLSPFITPYQLVLGAPPNPANGIPVLPRSRYRYYVRVTQILEHWTFGNSFTLGFELYRFTAPNTWAMEGPYTAEMTWTTAPAGFPTASDYLAGDVRNSSGASVGRLTMGWVSSYLRRATIEIDRVNVAEAPLDNGAGVTWNTIFNGVGWDVNVQVSDSNVAEPSGEGWSDAECHAGMLARRAATNLDAEWRYHVLAVRRLDSTPRGIMYDAFATDSNNVPREGASLSSHWTIPNADPWGLVKGWRFGTASAPYFRTAVHELGHAMGLYHNTVDNGIMNTTDVIAASGTATTPFPNNIQWTFAQDDAKKLRHYPDVFVRPGGTAFGGASATTPAISPTDLQIPVEGLVLRVAPTLEAVPLGAPVRVELELVNISDQLHYVPSSLSLKHGFVRGSVTDPAGNARTFLPLLRCVEERELKVLQPGESMRDSMTLLRGGQGALFGAAGQFRVDVEVHYSIGEAEVVVNGATTLMVTPVADEAHARAANAVLSEPDTLLATVIGGDHLTEGIAAIRTALNNPVLRPHFAYIEAKRVAKRFGKRKPDWKQVGSLIEDSTVMSEAEVEKARELIETAGDAVSPKVAKAVERKGKSPAHR
jgi:hypothetical protein